MCAIRVLVTEIMVMMGFVMRQVIPSQQLCDVHGSELTEQMETPRISSSKHTHCRASSFIHSLAAGQSTTDQEIQTQERRDRKTDT